MFERKGKDGSLLSADFFLPDTKSFKFLLSNYLASESFPSSLNCLEQNAFLLNSLKNQVVRSVRIQGTFNIPR